MYLELLLPAICIHAAAWIVTHRACQAMTTHQRDTYEWLTPYRLDRLIRNTCHVRYLLSYADMNRLRLVSATTTITLMLLAYGLIARGEVLLLALGCLAIGFALKLTDYPMHTYQLLTTGYSLLAAIAAVGIVSIPEPATVLIVAVLHFGIWHRLLKLVIQPAVPHPAIHRR